MKNFGFFGGGAEITAVWVILFLKTIYIIFQIHFLFQLLEQRRGQN